MSQRKKDDVREAILAAAFRLFGERGYVETSVPAIAREAGISSANVYVYFGSKLDILYRLYEPWLAERLDALERTLAGIADPSVRLERLLLALWRDLPRASNGFANNVMQAVSTTPATGEYSPRLRELFQQRVAGWLAGCLALGARDAERLAGALLMAFDGFAMNVRLAHGVACDAALARLVAMRLAGSAGPGRTLARTAAPAAPAAPAAAAGAAGSGIRTARAAPARRRPAAR